MKQGQFPAVLPLSSLNGPNGFKIDGESNYDNSGHSISGRDDLNGDGYVDFIIGAYGYPNGNNQGRSYVIFGGPEVGKTGSIALSSLNGLNGFKIEGEGGGDWSGASVSMIGDFNGDNFADLVIGAQGYPNNDFKGRSYVVYGGAKVGGNGFISLTNLNGTNGFKLEGENNGDYSGWYVSAAGNVNGDRFTDLLIGAHGYPSNTLKGRSYVVFGGPNVGASGLISLSDLDGSNGFKLDGENDKDNSGFALCVAGDVNRDGYSDVLIGAQYYPKNLDNKGRTYLIFGSPQIGSGGVIALSDLNGTNGFKLDGENNNDFSGFSVSAAGDFNNDTYADFILGALNYNQIGRSYGVFGGPKVGESGLLPLANLNGTNGFKLDGESSTGGFSYNGVSVGGVDINGDGYSDLLTCADHMDIMGQTDGGRCYVVFGVSGAVDKDGVVALSNLNGVNGFKIDGELSYGLAGLPIVGIGDINNDGIEDLAIGARNTSVNGLNEVGRSYVILGDVPPILVNNRLVINQNQTVLLNSSFLLATDKNHNPSQIFFKIDNLQHGQFQLNTNPPSSVTYFSQQDISEGRIYFQHDDSTSPPVYTVAVNTTGIAYVAAQSASIDFDTRPILVTNMLSINQGQAKKLTTSNLIAIHNGVADPNLLFDVTNLTHATMWIQSYLMQNSEIVFTQQILTAGGVTLIHDGSDYAPGYAVSVSDGRTATLPETCNVTFYKKPVITANQLFLQFGKSLLLNTDNLCINDCTQTTNDNLIFIVLNTPQYGQFEWADKPGQAITSFSQKQIRQGLVQFQPNGMSIAPNYQLLATDPNTGLSGESSIGNTLMLIANDWPINQNETFTLTPSVLNAISSTGGNIIYTPISDTVSHGYFALSASPDYRLPSFQQSQVDREEVVFIPDGSASAPAAVIAIADSTSGGAYGSFTCIVDFAMPPLLEHAFLKISPPDKIVLSNINLQASDPLVAAETLIFEVSDVKNDRFAYTWAWENPITNFTQQSIQQGQVYFIAESNQPPSFQVSVWNGRLHCQGCPKLADIIAPSNNSSGTQFSELQKALIGLGLSLGVSLGVLVVKSLMKKYFKSRKDESIDDYLTFAVLDEFWIGICGIFTGSQYEKYKKAIGYVIDQIEAKDENRNYQLICKENKDGISGTPLREVWGKFNLGMKEQVSLRIRAAIKEVLEINQNACWRFFRSSCGSEITSDKIQKKISEITKKVAEDKLIFKISADLKDQQAEEKYSILNNSEAEQKKNEGCQFFKSCCKWKRTDSNVEHEPNQKSNSESGSNLDLKMTT
ncbi:MAG: FG-GAP repeat protein [Proteobacteria bacterium]|nr:FG-GAP repeat protein [Pseudomonadota bacterium]